MENDFDLGKFVQFAGCQTCGTQRCSPGDETWREACPHYDNFNSINFTDKYAAFWGGVFSNFYPCKITVPVMMGDTDHMTFETFKSSEQYFMWQKAVFFEDYEVADEILEAKTPKEAKALGRKVKNYNDEKWAEHRLEAMEKAVYEKFSQNPDLCRYLINPLTEARHFVEGSPYDKIWGAGVSWCDPAIADEENWDGLNLLGKTLDKVRRTLIEEKQ